MNPVNTAQAIADLANMLDGREYRNETTEEIEKFAKENNLVIAFGYSDGNVEFRGAIRDEIGGYDGAVAVRNGVVLSRGGIEIRAQWIDGGDPCPWLITSNAIVSGSFTILEEGELFCIGTIFCLSN